jgi:SPP1 family predicted phage head-tail adaptor
MTYDHELKLISKTTEANDIGDSIATETETVILCGLKSVGRTEFYQANASGLRPERIFVIHGYEYSGQQTAEFEGVRYSVIRTYETSFEEMELTCAGLVNEVS